MRCASQRLARQHARRQVQQLLRQHHRARVVVDAFRGRLQRIGGRITSRTSAGLTSPTWLKKRRPSCSDEARRGVVPVVEQRCRGARCRGCRSARRIERFAAIARRGFASARRRIRRKHPRSAARRNRAGPCSWKAIERGLASSRTSRSSTGSHSGPRHVARAVGDDRVGEPQQPGQVRVRRARRAPAAASRTANCRRSMRRPIDRKRQPGSRVMPSSAKPDSVVNAAMSRVELAEHLGQRDRGGRGCAARRARHAVERAPVVERQPLAQLRCDAQQLPAGRSARPGASRR